MNTTWPVINRRLRGRRLAAGLTEAQVAEEIARLVYERVGRQAAIDSNYISKLERRKITWPNRDYRQAFRTFFGAATDAELGFYAMRTKRDTDQWLTRQPAFSASAVALSGQYDVGVAATQAVPTWQAIGRAIRRARVTHGWRQADLAIIVGCSASTISRLETGRSVVHQLLAYRAAQAVGISVGLPGVSPLISPRGRATVGGIDKLPEGEASVRRRDMLAVVGLAVPAHLLTGMNDVATLMPTTTDVVSPAAMARRLARARKLFDVGDTVHLIRILPSLLASAHDLARARKNPVAFTLLASCYNLATDALIKVGDTANSSITADRAVTYASLSESPAVAAFAARSLSIVLRHQGRTHLAEELALDAATEIERTGLTTSIQVASYAQILCTCAYNAAQAGNRDQALDIINEAQLAAARVPGNPLPGYVAPVTPAQVILYKIGVHWSLGDAGAALHSARHLHPAQLPTPERRARMHTDIARAWFQWGRPEEAATALVAAHRESPAEVTGRPSIRKIAEQLITQNPRRLEVRELSAVIGTETPIR